MTDKNYSNITIEEALEWTKDKCSHANVRKRMIGRASAFILANYLAEAVNHIHNLEAKIKELENGR